MNVTCSLEDELFLATFISWCHPAVSVLVTADLFNGR